MGAIARDVALVVAPFIDRQANYFTPSFSAKKIIHQLADIRDSITVVDLVELVRDGAVHRADEALYERCAEQVLRCRPRVVLFMSTTFCNMSSSLIIAEELKKADHPPTVVFGGHHSSLHAEYLLENFQQVDYVVYGYSDLAGAQLVRACLAGESPRGLDSVCYRDGRSVVVSRVHTGASETPVLTNAGESACCPDGTLSGGSTDFLCEVGFGCGSNCIRCAGCSLRGLRVLRPVELVLDQLRAWRSNDSWDFFLYDLFLLDRESIESLCGELARSRPLLAWHTRAMADVLDGQLISLLVAAGCRRISVGTMKIPMGNAGRLQDCLSQARDLLPLLEEHGLPASIYLDFGEPGETDERLERKLELILAASNSPLIDFTPFVYSSPVWVNGCDTVLSRTMMTGIDFAADGVFIERDVELVERHPHLFSNLYVRRQDHDRSAFLSKHAAIVIKSFRNSITFLQREAGLSLVTLFDDMLSFTQESGGALGTVPESIARYFSRLEHHHPAGGVLAYESAVYGLLNGVERHPLIRYGEGLYVMELAFSRVRGCSLERSSHYILKRSSDKVQVYAIDANVYREIVRNRHDVGRCGRLLLEQLSGAGLL